MGWVEIDKDELVKAISVLELVPQVGGITSSDYLRVSQKTDQLEFALASSIVGVVRITADIEAKKTFYVARKVFSPFVLAGKDSKKKFQSSFNGDKWTLRQGSRRAELVIRDDEIGGYGKWNLDSIQETAVSKEMKTLMEVANRCATSDPSLPILNCVYLKDDCVLASNQTVVFSATLPSGSSLNCPFPREVISILSHELVETVGIEGNRIILMSKYGCLEATVAAAPKKSFPVKNIHTQMEKAKTHQVIAKLPSETVKKMMDRMTDYLSTMEDRDFHLHLDTAPGKMQMRVKTGHGLFIESDSSDVYTQTRSFGWSLATVKPVFDYIAENTGKIIIRADEKKKSPYLIQGAGINLLVARKTV